MEPPPPSGEILSLLTNLSNYTTPSTHTNALSERDKLLSTSAQSYGQTCVQFARVLHCPNPNLLPQSHLDVWSQCDGGVSIMQLRHDPTGGWGQLREMAGLLLKNALIKPPPNMMLPTENLEEVLVILMKGIVDESTPVRRVSSSIISSGTVGCPEGEEALPLSHWGQTLTPYLVKALEDPIAAVQKGEAVQGPMQHALLGSLQTLSKMLEDGTSRFERESGPAFQKIVPNLLLLIKLCGEERVKRDALSSLVSLIYVMPSSLVAKMDEFFETLSGLGSDPSEEVRKLVCQAIVTLLGTRSEYLQSNITPIAHFIINATSDPSPVVALEACEFWLTFSSMDEETCTPAMADAIQSLLPQVIPILVKGMIYPQEKIEELLESNIEEEGMQEDKAQDMAPVFHKSKSKGGGREDGNDSDDDDDDGGDDADEYDDKQWTLRTCSAASLDALAGVYDPQCILPHLLPALQESLEHSEPWVREAGILALGAVANGCDEAIKVHMGQLHPFLMSQVTDDTALPQLKSISCWTIARYISWAVEQTASGVQSNLIAQITEVILKRVHDKNRKVQIAACSALGVIVENAGFLMTPYLEPLFQGLVQAMGRYQSRAIMILFDTIAAMADQIGEAIGEAHLTAIYIPPMLQLWSTKTKQNPFDLSLLPLMESLASVAMNTGMNFQPYALQTFDGAMSSINQCMMILSAEGKYADEEADPVVCATDLLDGLVEGLGPNFSSLVSSSTQFGQYFLPVLRSLVGHEIPSVRMSAFALLGDIARHCPHLLQEGMKELLFEAISCMDSMYPSVCNNAVWSVGEICVKCEGNPESLRPYAFDIVQGLIVLLMGSEYEEGEFGSPVAGLVENAASTMGRLAKVNPQYVAGDLHRFLSGWCDGMGKISDPAERRDAFEGFMLTVKANPESIKTASENILDTLRDIVFAIVSWHIPTGNISPEILQGEYAFTIFPDTMPDLAQSIGQFLHSLKELVGPNIWAEFEKHTPVNIRRLLREQYNL